MTSLTYGQLPTSLQYERAWRRVVGELSDAPDYYGDAYYDYQEVWDFLRWLTHRWEQGSDCAGDIASSILTVLDFEWI